MLISVQEHLLILRLPVDMVEEFDSLIEEGVRPQQTGEAKQEDSGIVEIVPDMSASSPKAASSTGSPSGCDRFKVTLKDVVYPALLMNLPAPVEAHKLMEGSSVVKSGDIGQVLQMFRSVQELEETEAQLQKSTVKGTQEFNPKLDLVLNDGLAPVTANIVKNRYDLTRKYIAPAMGHISELVDEISRAIKQKAVLIDDTEERRVLKTVEERVVPFEQWMVDEENPYGIEVVFDRKPEAADSINLPEEKLEALLKLRAEGEEEADEEAEEDREGS